MGARETIKLDPKVQEAMFKQLSSAFGFVPRPKVRASRGLEFSSQLRAKALVSPASIEESPKLKAMRLSKDESPPREYGLTGDEKSFLGEKDEELDSLEPWGAEEESLVGESFADSLVEKSVLASCIEETVVPEFNRELMKGREVWLPRAYDNKILFEKLTHDKPFAIYRFQLQDMLAFSESEPDFLYGRPSFHDIWETLESGSGMLVVAYHQNKFDNLHAKFDISSVFDEKHRIKNPEIFEDLLGGVLLKPSYFEGNPVLRIYSLISNPLNKKDNITGIGTNLLKFAVEQLSPEKRYKGLVFYFDGFDPRVNKVYFTKTPELGGIIAGMTYETGTIPKLKGVIPLGDTPRNHSLFGQPGLEDCIKEVKPAEALNGQEFPFKIEVPAHVKSEDYTEAHRELVAVWQKRLNGNGGLCYPTIEAGKLYHNFVAGKLF